MPDLNLDIGLSNDSMPTVNIPIEIPQTSSNLMAIMFALFVTISEIFAVEMLLNIEIQNGQWSNINVIPKPIYYLLFDGNSNYYYYYYYYYFYYIIIIVTITTIYIANMPEGKINRQIESEAHKKVDLTNV